MKTPRLLLVLLVLSTGCQRHSTTSGVTSVLNEDGTTRARKATAAELARVETSWNKIAAVDRLYPRPTVPVGISAARGARMVPPGAVKLTDDRIVHLDGIRCSTLGFDHLERLLIGPDISLLVVPTGPTQDGAIPADIWTVERIGDSVAYAFPAETALTSGWCDAERSSTSPHNERFEALQRAFAEERREFAGNAR